MPDEVYITTANAGCCMSPGLEQFKERNSVIMMVMLLPSAQSNLLLSVLERSHLIISGSLV